MLHRSLLFIVACTVAAPARAQVGHDHKDGPEELGVVEFPIMRGDGARGLDRGPPCSIPSATRRRAGRSLTPSRSTPRAGWRSGVWR